MNTTITYAYRPAGIRTGMPALQEAQDSQQKVDQLTNSLRAHEEHVALIDGRARDTQAELSAQEQAFRQASSRSSIAFKTLVAGAGGAAIGALVGQLVPGAYGLAITAVGALMMVGGGVVLVNNDVRRTEAAIRRGGLRDRATIFEDARQRTSSTIDNTRRDIGSAVQQRDAALQRVQEETTPVVGSIDVGQSHVNIGGLSIPRRT